MGNPFCHIELAADDTGAAKKFYKSVFDWKLEDSAEMQYTMINVGKGVGGGMTGKQMPQQPTAWLPYVEVANVEATLAKAKKAGATITVPSTSIGENMGSIGVFVDPQGAVLGVWALGKPAAPKKSAAKKKAAPKAKKPAKKGKR